MQKFSLLDLAPIVEGKTAADALASSTELAIAAEAAGYHRYWVAEHHNMAGIASSATAIVIGQLARATRTLRVGAGGIMLPNHAPLMVAEQFGTLETLFPGRIDLGLGRAPGTDMATARALRRNLGHHDTFPQDVQELLEYLGEMPDTAPVRAIPGMGTDVPVWILGSSLFGAQLAAHLGLPYAFASHFAPDHLEEALQLYRARFQPSRYLQAPYAMMAAGVCVAPTDAEAEFLRSSQILAMSRIITNQRGKLPAPVEDVEARVPAQVLAQARHMMSCSAVGAPQTAKAQLGALIDRYQPDELMITGMIHDHSARVRSFQMAAEVLMELCTEPA